MRAVLFAVLVVLACTMSVSASSADWSAPEALWSSELSSSELEARHSEFLMATEGSSTGPANYTNSSSSSAGETPVLKLEPITVQLNLDVSDCTANSTDSKCAFTPAALDNTLNTTFGFPDPNLPGEKFVTTLTALNGTTSSSSSSSSTGAAFDDASSSSSSAPGRRLLQVGAGGTEAKFEFIGSPVDGGVHARLIYAAFVESLKCTTSACLDAVTAKYSLPASPASNPAFNTLASTAVLSTLKVDDEAVAAGSNDALNTNGGNERNVQSVGGPRNTNVGYYVLGAVLLAFIVAALIYFIVHKKPVQAVVKEEPLRGDEVALAPVVAAPVAAPAHSGVVVAEEQPLAAGQQQMDYRSVFALKHNVLDKSAEQKAAEEDEHNHNDVHFILHQ